ncbi:MAG TPA: lipopolysaccharide biosynthesis protein, partial [Gammaproteobacteria bacterium]|nr:lipopolysaccharide biosynthesis protein [Gammaproteobacteria bacterium]
MIKAFASLAERASAFIGSRSNFFRDVVVILTGTVASRIIVLLAIPFLARIYTPAEFGVLALFMTIN